MIIFAVVEIEHKNMNFAHVETAKLKWQENLARDIKYSGLMREELLMFGFRMFIQLSSLLYLVCGKSLKML